MVGRLNVSVEETNDSAFTNSMKKNCNLNKRSFGSAT